MATNTTKQSRVCDKLLELLSEVDRPGKVCTSGDLPLTMPGLEVEGLGTIRFPLGKTQARQLIKLCEQAPYGKGTETLVDTDVRRVWELDPARFQLTNPKWNDLVASILETVRQELGLEDRKLQAHLYKLLVYEPGSFFLPHQDGEKLDRMVATLVIGLPAVHEGGELIITHDGAQDEVELTGAASGLELSFAAFYADCRHEIRPVRSGFRLCLTYNVTLAKSRGKRGVAAPSYTATTAAIGELLRDWRNSSDAHKLALTLNHEYTQEGLTLDTLKGIDRVQAKVLFDAAEQADCTAHLALLTLWQCGMAEGGNYGRRRSRWSGDDDFRTGGGPYEMGEIYEHSLSADHWSDRDGFNVPLGKIPFDEDEIVAPVPLTEDEPSNEEFEGYTGNAGMTLERWYCRAAVVIWPSDRHFDVLCDAGLDAAIGGLQSLVRRLKKVPKGRREEERRNGVAFAKVIIASWQKARHERWYGRSEQDSHRIFPALLCELDDPEPVRRFLSQVMPGDSRSQFNASLVKFCNKHGWDEFAAELAAVIDTATPGTIPRNAEFLRILCTVRDKNADRIRVCTQLCQRAVASLVSFDEQSPKDHGTNRQFDRAGVLCEFIAAALSIQAEETLARLIEHTLADDRYNLIDAHLKAIFELESRLLKFPSAAIGNLVQACRRELEARTVEPPQPPADYQRASGISCRCPDCKTLSRFLADPDEPELRLPLAKRRRQHLHGIIDHNHCDCTHVTERRGRPYTLVCTKTTRSYDEACKTYEQDLQHLSRVKPLENDLK